MKLISDTTRATQCAALLQALSIAPISTIKARDRLGIASPAARVLDLRKAGYSITTAQCTDFDAQGRPHRSALYRLHTVSQGGPA